MLREACEREGSRKAWASARGLSLSYVGDALNGRRKPGRKLLDSLGYERVTVYRREGFTE